MTKFQYSLDSKVQHCTTINNIQQRPMLYNVMIVQWSRGVYSLRSIGSMWITPVRHDGYKTHAAICFCLCFCFSCHPNSQYISVHTQQLWIKQKVWSHPSINLHDYNKEWFYHSIPASSNQDFFVNRWTGILSPLRQGEQVFTIVRTYFLCARRFWSWLIGAIVWSVKISKSTGPDIFGSCQDHNGSLAPQTAGIFRGPWGITGYGDDWLLVCLVCISSWGRWTLVDKYILRAFALSTASFPFPEWSWQIDSSRPGPGLQKLFTAPLPLEF